LLSPVLASASDLTPPGTTEAIDLEPYRVSFCLSCDPSSRIDEAGRLELLREWQILARRFVGASWILSIAPASSPLANVDLETVEPAAFSKIAPCDKVWIVRIARDRAGSDLDLAGREYDVVTRQLGPLQRRPIMPAVDMPRALFLFTRDLFNPTARITGQEGGKALLIVRGASIVPASPHGQVATPGTVFLPLRLVALANGTVRVLRIPFTYLQVEQVEGHVARCAINSALMDPLTRRVQNPNTLAGLGVKPAAAPSRLRFVTKPDGAPAAGYTLSARRVPQGLPRELGATDRSGRIVLQPGFADGLVILRLLAGNVEPLVELPFMPGESSLERVIAIDPLRETVALEAQIDSLRDEVVDLVAMRARLEARMKARADGEDWDAVADAIKEYARLTPRDEVAQRLAKLKENAARQQADTKKTILTRTAQAQIADLQSTIDRYLDDDAFKAYSEALNQGRSKANANAKAGPKSAPAARAPVTAAAGSAHNPTRGAGSEAPAPQAPPSPAAPGQAEPKQPAAPNAPSTPF
jgi:hypothetical protein